MPSARRRSCGQPFWPYAAAAVSMAHGEFLGFFAANIPGESPEARRGGNVYGDESRLHAAAVASDEATERCAGIRRPAA